MRIAALAGSHTIVNMMPTPLSQHPEEIPINDTNTLHAGWQRRVRWQMLWIFVGKLLALGLLWYAFFRVAGP